MPTTTRLATVQLTDPSLSPPTADPFHAAFSMAAAEQAIEARISAFGAQLRIAGAAGCDLVVMTEAWPGTTPALTYLDDRSIFRALVETWGPVVNERVAAVAAQYRMHVVSCQYEKEGADIYNVATLFGRHGEVVGRYRKVHLPVYEAWTVKSGATFDTFETDFGIVGMMICYDFMWPESACTLAMNGADVICVPSAYSPPEFRVRARALDVGVHYVTSTWSNSMIVDAKANVLANAGTEAMTVVHADVDLAAANLAPENYYEYIYSGIRDHRKRHLKLRRSDAYGPVCLPDPPLAQRYPAAGLADTPEEIQRVYALHKAERRALLQGRPGRYTWQW